MTDDSPVATYFRLRAESRNLLAIKDERARSAATIQLNREFKQCVARLFEMARTDPQVCYAIGDALALGRGTPCDKTGALTWFRRAAKAGIPEAMVRFHLSAQRSGDAELISEGIRWLGRSAELGYPGAMVWLGFAYREGHGVKADYEQAVAWFIKAVEAGDTHATMHVGRMFAQYMDRPADALPWFHKAADAGRVDSHIYLAWLYGNPDSPVYSPHDSRDWYERVALSKSLSAPQALLRLAKLHLSGRGLPSNLLLARQWLKRLLSVAPEDSSYYKEATILLDKLADSMI